MKRPKIVGKYDIEYLDNELLGIFNDELVLLGARSGAGKTTLANQIALKNSDKKVALFSLENFEGDLLLFETFKEYKKLSTEGKGLGFREFCIKEEDTVMKMAEEKAKAKLDKINIVYRKPGGFNIQDMVEEFTRLAREKCEIFIIDHIDYFDMHKPKENENTNISEIMKEIRKLQDIYDVPVILISHLRKGTRETLIPTLEDFMGTSNKVKEATTVILFAPDDEANTENNTWVKQTWVCIRKDRKDGYKNTVANIGFDPRDLSYAENYIRYKVNYWGNKVEEMKVWE